MKSGNQVYYQSDFAAGANLADWHEVVIDLTRAAQQTAFSGVMINDVQLIGFEALLNTAPAVGAPATPSQVLLLVDDIWLEAAPPSDAGTGDAATPAVSESAGGRAVALRTRSSPGATPSGADRSALRPDDHHW